MSLVNQMTLVPAQVQSYLNEIGAQYRADRSPEPAKRQIFYAPRLVGQEWIALERHGANIWLGFYADCPCGYAAGADYQAQRS